MGIFLGHLLFVLAQTLVVTGDRDDDGVPDDIDNCVDTGNWSQSNRDGDCFGDACDVDGDGDGIADYRDTCPMTFATHDDDLDEDGVGDACDVCPRAWDPGQLDGSELFAGEYPDGVGDACDPHPTTGGDRRSDLFLEVPLSEPNRHVEMTRYYRVRRGDTPERLAKRFHVTVAELDAMNDGLLAGRLWVGALVSLRFERLLPLGVADGITINVPERTLYVMRGDELRAIMPVGVGRGPTEIPTEDWSTRVGHFRVTAKRERPTWRVPPSIREEMMRLGEDVLTVVPPGPRNPLGNFAITTSGGFLLHEAVNPDSVLGFASHGCVRLLPEDIRELFLVVRDGAPVTVVYEDVKLLRTSEGRLLLEAHPDQYRAFADALMHTTRLLATIGDLEVDDDTLQRALEDRNGRIVDVSRHCSGRAGELLARCRWGERFSVHRSRDNIDRRR